MSFPSPRPGASPVSKQSVCPLVAVIHELTGTRLRLPNGDERIRDNPLRSAEVLADRRGQITFPSGESQELEIVARGPHGSPSALSTCLPRIEWICVQRWSGKVFLSTLVHVGLLGNWQVTEVMGDFL